MRLSLLLLFCPSFALASPVIVPKVEGLPIFEPAAPSPEPCTQRPCPART